MSAPQQPAPELRSPSMTHIGFWVYERIEELIDAEPDTPEAIELQYLASIVEPIEAHGLGPWPTETPRPSLAALQPPTAYEGEPPTAQTVGWAALASNSNIRLWSGDEARVRAFASKHGCEVVRIVHSAPVINEGEPVECPTCGSDAPHRHPAVQCEGEVEVCADAFHLRPTSQNRPAYIAAVETKRAALFAHPAKPISEEEISAIIEREVKVEAHRNKFSAPTLKTAARAILAKMRASA